MTIGFLFYDEKVSTYWSEIISTNLHNSFSCSNERKVSFYVNEGRVQYPGCDKGVCSWSLLKEKFKNEILKECPAGKESSATRLLSVNMLTVIHAVAFIFIFNSWCKFTSV